MSVEIYGVDDSASDFCSIGVSAEETFNTIWQGAIDALGLRLIGNMKWLYKKDLPEILSEFEQVREYVWKDRNLSEAVRESIREHVDYIVKDLEENWDECPGADRLWMG